MTMECVLLNQEMIDELSGTWTITEMVYQRSEGDQSLTSPVGTIDFAHCDIKEEKEATCPGRYTLSDGTEVGFDYSVSYVSNQVGFSTYVPDDTLGLENNYFKIEEQSDSTRLLTGTTYLNDQYINVRIVLTKTK